MVLVTASLLKPKPFRLLIKAALTKKFKLNLTVMYLYKNCGDMPIFNFDMVSRTNDLKYMVVGYDGYSDIKVPKGANERFQEIRNEWVKLLDDNTILYYYELILDVVYLETRYEVVDKLLYNMWYCELDDEELEMYIKALKDFRYHWNRKATKFNEVKRLKSIHKASLNKISLKRDELEKMQKKHNLDEQPRTLSKQAVALEQITGRDNIDVKTTSVEKWIEICKMATEISEQRRKNMRRNG